MMASRERVQEALEHREADRVPLDLGGSAVTGMHVDSVYKLRQALQLDPPGTPVKVVEPFWFLGEIGHGSARCSRRGRCVAWGTDQFYGLPQ
jgi:hypothetical protein